MSTTIRKQGGRETTATERMEAARRVKHEAITRELLWACVASRSWPACLMPPQQPSPNLPLLLVIDTPAGRLAYRLSAEELKSGLFDHLEKRRNDGQPADDKLGVLLGLAQSCTRFLSRPLDK